MDGLEGYDSFRGTLIRQIVDLREMDENGFFKSEHRYLSVCSPRKSNWYNFDPLTYIECAMAGSFNGWDQYCETRAKSISKPVSEFETENSTRFNIHEEENLPTNVKPSVTWWQMQQFIVCGQIYE